MSPLNGVAVMARPGGTAGPTITPAVMRAAIVAEARTWIGTPWQHQGRLRGAGVDCAGLVIEVARALGLAEPMIAPYGPQPTGEQMRLMLGQYMVPLPIASIAPGDVLLFRFALEPQHVAIVSDYPHGLALIHSYRDNDGVVEHRFADVWRARAVAAFAFPGLA